MKFILLLSMMFCHIIDDYKLQGILAEFKQRSWWQEHAPAPMYKHDYIIALIEHAFSWTFMIHLPVVIYCMYFDCLDIYCIAGTFILNWALHACIDHLKANVHSINLVQDQLSHFGQIVLTWCMYAFIVR